MANIKSKKKRIITNEKNRQRNVSVRSRIKTYTKNLDAALEAKDADKIRELLPKTLSEIDRAVTKGVIHGNAAARKKSRLQRTAAAAL